MSDEETEDTYAPGDVVRLRSGGPDMTITGLTTRTEPANDEDDAEEIEVLEADVAWFHGPDLRSAILNVDALETVKAAAR